MINKCISYSVINRTVSILMMRLRKEKQNTNKNVTHIQDFQFLERTLKFTLNCKCTKQQHISKPRGKISAESLNKQEDHHP